MKTSRRQLLQLSLGLGQLGLLGGLAARPRAAQAQATGAPTRLLSIYLSGGYTPQYFYAPFTEAQAARHVMPFQDSAGETAGYLPSDILEVSSGGGGHGPIRVGRTWDPASPGSRAQGPGRKWLPLGYSWLEHDLFRDAVVIHGIDQGTAAHESGYIAAMCGVAGSEYRAPAYQSVLANHLYQRFADTRPLPCVGLDGRGMPQSLTLPARSAPSYVPNVGSVGTLFSDRDQRNAWWRGLNLRSDLPDFSFDGTPAGTIPLTNLERRALERTRALRGKSTKGTDTFLESVHDAYRGVSKALARNIADVLEVTRGVEHLTGHASFAGATPYGSIGGKYGWTYGLANYHATDAMFEPTFELMLRLFKADLASAVHLYMPELYFDRHAGREGHIREFVDMRGGMDAIARLLGEMKRTVLPGGKTLLEDTLVVIFSEFARTWASGTTAADFLYPDDHWPVTSVTLVGGGLAGGREVGGYDLTGFNYGPRGLPVEILEEDGQTSRRPPMAADVTATILRVMGLGIHDFFIPGGYGEIVGVRAT
jgi:hypothetical protein